jgi:hypothetical protein
LVEESFEVAFSVGLDIGIDIGISTDTEALLSHRITIPRQPGGGAESLNAAVAAGILAAFLTGGRLTT